jgi:hypothetical protein
MATSRPFAYNTKSPISGTEQVGSIASGTPDVGFESTDLEWWNGPDEDLGYVICEPVPNESQSTPVKMYWDSNKVGTGNTLSNNNLTVTSTGFSSVLAESKIFGRVMFSIQLEQSATSSYIGIGKSDMDLNSYVGGSDGKSVGFASSGDILFGGSYMIAGLPSWGTIGDVIDIAIDSSIPEFWVRVNGGDWNGNPTSNPGENIGGLSFPMSVTDTYPAITIYKDRSGSQATLVTSPFTLPSFYNNIENYASLRFFRSTNLTEGAFVDLVNSKYSQNFSTGNQAKTYLTTNGYWSSYTGFGSSGFQWMTMNSIGSTNASGVGQNGITISITQSGGGMAIENGMYSASTFPQEYGVPFTGNQIQNNNSGIFTAVFSQPVYNALVAFASVGNGNLGVPVIVSVPFTPIWGQATTYQNPVGTQSQYTQFTGTEGFNIIRIDGTASSVSFNYTVSESYSTICFGFVDQNA